MLYLLFQSIVRVWKLPISSSSKDQTCTLASLSTAVLVMDANTLVLLDLQQAQESEQIRSKFISSASTTTTELPWSLQWQRSQLMIYNQIHIDQTPGGQKKGPYSHNEFRPIGKSSPQTMFHIYVTIQYIWSRGTWSSLYRIVIDIMKRYLRYSPMLSTNWDEHKVAGFSKSSYCWFIDMMDTGIHYCSDNHNCYCGDHFFSLWHEFFSPDHSRWSVQWSCMFMVIGTRMFWSFQHSLRNIIMKYRLKCSNSIQRYVCLFSFLAYSIWSLPGEIWFQTSAIVSGREIT